MIHFYFGEDDIELKRQISKVIEAFSKKYSKENISKINANQENINDIIEKLINVSLFSQNRLIVISEIFSNKYLSEKFSEILDRIPKETEVIIIEPNPDKRTKLYKILIKEYKSKEFKTNKNIFNFIKNEIETRKININEEAIQELIIYTGQDRWKIINELEKLANLNKTISKELIHKYVEPDVQASVFNILDNLLIGKKDLALNELKELKIHKDANKFFGLLSSQIFALAIAVNSNNKNNREVAQEAKIHPYVMSKMFEYTKNITREDIKHYSQIISETDTKLKTTKTDPWNLIELAISRF